MTALVIILIYLGLLLLLGGLSGRFFRGTASDYFLASRGIGSFLLVMSLFGTTMTAFALVGSTGESFRDGIGVYGLMASWSGIVHSAVFFLVGIKLWSFGKRFGYVTQIQFFRDRFESDKLGLLLFPILVGLVIPYLLIGVMGAGVTIEKVTGGALPQWFSAIPGPTGREAGAVPFAYGSALICLIVLVYVFFGGVRGTAWANAFQTIIFIVLGGVTFFLIADRFGGVQAATAAVQERNPHVLRRTVRPDDPLTRYHGDMKVYEAKLARWQAAPPEAKVPKPEEPVKPHGITQLHFLSYMFIPLSVGMFPHLFQHWLTARTAKAFRLSVIAHPLLIALVWTPCVLIGAWATSAVLSDKPVIPYGFGNVNAVLPKLVADLTTPVLSGLLSAGVLAAIMSSLDSQFLCLGSIFTNDIVAHYLRHDRLSDTARVWLGRGFVVLIVGVTWWLAQYRPGGIFTLGVWCFSGFAALFPLVFAAVYWPRTTKAGAYASIVAVAVVWTYMFWQSGWGGNENYMFYGVMPVVPITLIGAAALLLVSLVTPPPAPATLAKFFGKSHDVAAVHHPAPRAVR